MRDLVLITLILLLLLAVWGFYIYYCDNVINQFIGRIEGELIPLVEGGSWEEGMEAMLKFQSEWEIFRRVAMHFTDTRYVNDIDFSIARASLYIEAEDVSNSAGELNSVRSQLKSLLENEMPSLRTVL